LANEGEHEAELVRSEVSMIRVCGFDLKDDKQNMAVRELLDPGTSQLVN